MYYKITLFMAITLSFPALGMQMEVKMQHDQEAASSRDSIALTPCLDYANDIASITGANRHIVRTILEYVNSLNLHAHINGHSYIELIAERKNQGKPLLLVQRPKPNSNNLEYHLAQHFHADHLWNNNKPLLAPVDAIHCYSISADREPSYLYSYKDLLTIVGKNKDLVRKFFLYAYTREELTQKMKTIARRKINKRGVPRLNLGRSTSRENDLAHSPNQLDAMLRRHPHSPIPI